MSDLKKRLIKNSTIKETALLTESKIFGKKDMIQTRVPMINVALSGRVDGGLTPGLTVLAGPSRHFKTAFALLMASAFLAKYPDGVILFYDSEFGTPESYFNSFGVDGGSVVHTPITDIEQLKHDIMVQLAELTREDKVLILVDSVGNLASKKEVEDSLAGKSVADMTRAKALKSLFRMVTPHLTIKDFPMIVVNHTYQTIEMYSKAVVSGGTGIMYSADNVWIIGRQQDKPKDSDLLGYDFIINIEKSRWVKEKSKIPISVSFEHGINRWSGLLDVAYDGGYVVKTKPGYYSKVDKLTGEIFDAKGRKESDIIDDSAFWKDMFQTTDLADWISTQYTLAHGPIMSADDDESISDFVEDSEA